MSVLSADSRKDTGGRSPGKKAKAAAEAAARAAAEGGANGGVMPHARPPTMANGLHPDVYGAPNHHAPGGGYDEEYEYDNGDGYDDQYDDDGEDGDDDDGDEGGAYGILFGTAHSPGVL
ncbi:hypothetical protein FRC04_006113 [Tulasnella sp. 424]|nr:hypothetical protein FRC04_006113 [Tulasnella sp. 424]KAG8962645.1 hypothetical protein FRC05_005164 [Tulasnella sp. 425]